MKPKKRNPLSYEPIYKLKDGELRDVTSMETSVAKKVNLVIYSIFAIFCFFILSIGLVSDHLEINTGYVITFMNNDVVKAIYLAVRIFTFVMAGIFVAYLFFKRREKKYEIMHKEGFNLLRTASFSFTMISVAVVDVTLLVNDPSNAWVLRWWRDGIVLFELGVIIDMIVSIPVTVLSTANLFVQLLKTRKQTSVELLFYKARKGYDQSVLVDTRAVRLQCTDTKKGRMCKIIGKMESNEVKGLDPF